MAKKYESMQKAVRDFKKKKHAFRHSSQQDIYYLDNYQLVITYEMSDIGYRKRSRVRLYEFDDDFELLIFDACFDMRDCDPEFEAIACLIQIEEQIRKNGGRYVEGGSNGA